MTIYLSRFCNSEKIILYTSMFFSFQNSKPLKQIWSHMFSNLLVRTGCSVVIDSVSSMIDKNPCGNDFFFIKSKSKSSFGTSQEWFIIFLTIMSKSITRSCISEKTHPDSNILRMRFYPLHLHSPFLSKTDIIPSLLMHLGKNHIFILCKIKYSCIWLKKILIRSARFPWNISHHFCIAILNLPKYCLIFLRQSTSIMIKSLIRKWRMNTKRKSPNLSKSNRTKFYIYHLIFMRKLLYTKCLSGRSENILPSFWLPKTSWNMIFRMIHEKSL